MTPSAAEPLDRDTLRAMLAHAPDAMVYADRAGIIRYWNAAAEALFGHAAAAVLGQSLDVIIPERFRVAHWTGYRKAVDTGLSKYGGRVMTTRALHADGQSRYVDLGFGLIKDDAGQVIGVLAIGRETRDPPRPRAAQAG